MIANGIKILAVGSVFLLLGGCVVGGYPDGYVVRETSYSYSTDSGPWYRVARHHHRSKGHAHYGPPRKSHESHAHYGPPKKHRNKSGAHYGPPSEAIPSVSVTS